VSAEAHAWLPTPYSLLLVALGLLVVVGLAFVAARVLRSLRHGFSIRLQLFLAISLVTLALFGVFGVLVFERAQARAAEIVKTYGLSVDAMTALITDFGPKLTVVAVLLGLGAAASALVLGRSVATPLERLTQAAEAIARGERQAVLPHPVGREVRRLTHAFESMRRALEDRHAIERFVADLSHELKNPVAAIRASCEVLSEGAAEDAEARTRFLRRIDEANRRLEVLLHDLLALARLEAHGLEADETPLELAEVVREAISGQAARAEARRVTFDARLTPIRVQGSGRWLRRAVDNLLANAVRYAPEESVVDVEVRVTGDFVAVTVRDRGPGVSPALSERIFERFVTERADVDGTGLGLAIVRSVAEHHGGTARQVPVDGPGACFELRLRA